MAESASGDTESGDQVVSFTQTDWSGGEGYGAVAEHAGWTEYESAGPGLEPGADLTLLLTTGTLTDTTTDDFKAGELGTWDQNSAIKFATDNDLGGVLDAYDRKLESATWGVYRVRRACRVHRAYPSVTHFCLLPR